MSVLFKMVGSEGLMPCNLLMPENERGSRRKDAKRLSRRARNIREGGRTCLCILQHEGGSGASQPFNLKLGEANK